MESLPQKKTRTLKEMRWNGVIAKKQIEYLDPTVPGTIDSDGEGDGGGGKQGEAGRRRGRGGEEDHTVLEQATRWCGAPSFAAVVTHRPSTASGRLIATVLCGTPASSTPLHLPSAPSFPPARPSL